MFMATKQIFKKFINLASISNKDTHLMQFPLHQYRERVIFTKLYFYKRWQFRYKLFYSFPEIKIVWAAAQTRILFGRGQPMTSSVTDVFLWVENGYKAPVKILVSLFRGDPGLIHHNHDWYSPTKSQGCCYRGFSFAQVAFTFRLQLKAMRLNFLLCSSLHV